MPHVAERRNVETGTPDLMQGSQNSTQSKTEDWHGDQDIDEEIEKHKAKVF